MQEDDEKEIQNRNLFDRRINKEILKTKFHYIKLKDEFDRKAKKDEVEEVEPSIVIKHKLNKFYKIYVKLQNGYSDFKFAPRTDEEITKMNDYKIFLDILSKGNFLYYIYLIR